MLNIYSYLYITFDTLTHNTTPLKSNSSCNRCIKRVLKVYPWHVWSFIFWISHKDSPKWDYRLKVTPGVQPKQSLAKDTIFEAENMRMRSFKSHLMAKLSQLNVF